MDSKQRLFTYSIWRDSRYLLATSKREIIETMKWYQDVRGYKHIPVPSEDDIRGYESFRWEICGAMAFPEHFIKVEALSGLNVEVNANAFDAFRTRVQQCLREPETKRGTMYKFGGGIGIEYTIGQDILDALAAYDWDKHTSQVDQWLGGRGKRLEEAGVVPIERCRFTKPKDDSYLGSCRKVLSNIADTFAKYWNRFYRAN